MKSEILSIWFFRYLNGRGTSEKNSGYAMMLTGVSLRYTPTTPGLVSILVCSTPSLFGGPSVL